MSFQRKDLEKKKVIELQKILKDKGIPVNNKKKDRLITDILLSELSKDDKSEPVFGEVLSKINNPDSNFVITSYWWGRGNVNKNSIRNRTYDKQIYDLAESCDKVKCNYYLVEIPQFAQKGMYQEAIGYKPEFIKRVLNHYREYGKTVIYIDSDIIVLKYPALFDTDNDFFSLNYMAYDTSCYAPTEVWLPGGLLGYANTNVGRKMLDMFIEEMRTKKSLAEDKVLSGLMTSKYMVINSRCCWVPENYMWIFTTHEYDTDELEYVSISTLAQDIKLEAEENDTKPMFKPKDIVMKHEDLETTELGDKLLKARNIQDDRFPKNFYKNMGKKLKCPRGKNIYYNYVDFGFDKRQQKQMEPYNNSLKSIVKNKMLPKYSELKTEIDIKKKYENITNDNFIIVSLIDDDTDDKIVENFIDNCYQYNYSIYKCKDFDKINLPVFLYKMIKKYQMPVLYVNIIYTIEEIPKLFSENKMQQDLMIFNMNNYKDCNDPRVLKTLNCDVIYLSNNKRVINTLYLWIQNNTKSLYKNGFSHKALEYVFNKCLLILKLRCTWLPIEYCKSKGFVSSRDDKIYIRTKYERDFDSYTGIDKLKIIKKQRQEIEQCSLQKQLIDGDPLPSHFKRSKGSGKRFKNDGLFM